MKTWQVSYRTCREDHFTKWLFIREIIQFPALSTNPALLCGRTVSCFQSPSMLWACSTVGFIIIGFGYLQGQFDHFQGGMTWQLRKRKYTLPFRTKSNVEPLCGFGPTGGLAVHFRAILSYIPTHIFTSGSLKNPGCSKSKGSRVSRAPDWGLGALTMCS